MRLLILVLVCGASLAGAGTAGSAPAGEARAAASRVVDRTFSCQAAALAPGVRELDALAIPAGSSWTGARQERPSPGYLSINAGGWEPGSELVAVRKKRWQRFGATTTPGVFALAASCRAVRATVSLRPTGLNGPTRWGESVSCLHAGRVLIRVRATLESPAVWQRATGSQFGVTRNVVAATVAVRGEKARKAFAVLKLDSKGRTWLWSSSGCN